MSYKLRAKLRSALPAWMLDMRRKRLPNNLSFAAPKEPLLQTLARSTSSSEYELRKIFFQPIGLEKHKWHHYFRYYDRHLSGYRNTSVRVLELGVGGGGGLQLWRSYFGIDAVIHGVDIEPECANYATRTEKVWIGSQSDQSLLGSILQEMGGVDVVVDDGSHHMRDIRESFEFLFPRMRDGGIYIIEDLHTAYWRHYGGGKSSRGNFFRYLQGIINDMHQWYIPPITSGSDIKVICSGVHVYDSMVFLERNDVPRPVHYFVK